MLRRLPILVLAVACLAGCQGRHPVETPEAAIAVAREKINDPRATFQARRVKEAWLVETTPGSNPTYSAFVDAKTGKILAMDADVTDTVVIKPVGAPEAAKP